MTLVGQGRDVLHVLNIIDRVLSIVFNEELPQSDNPTAELRLKVNAEELPGGGQSQYDFARHPHQPVLPELYAHINAALWLFTGCIGSGVMPDTAWLQKLRAFHRQLELYLDQTTDTQPWTE